MDRAIAHIADLVPLADESRNERLACETLLTLLESANVEVRFGLTLIDRVRTYVVERGGQHLTLRLAVQQSRFLSAAGRIDDERKVIGDALPELGRVGNEAVAEILLGRLAQIEQSAGRGDEEVLRLVQQSVSIRRRTIGAAIQSEQALGRLRVKTGLVPALPSVTAFLQTWRSHFPDLPQLLPRFATAAGVSKVDDLARSLEDQVGAEAALAWLVWTTAILCRQFREAGEPTLALTVAAGTLPMPLVFGDRQLSAILHNECGLNLLVLKHPDRALPQFTKAIDEATAAGDLAELVDDHVNAAHACEAMGRLDDAVQHLRQARQVHRGASGSRDCRSRGAAAR